jgi:hypothetical protein
LRLDLQEKYADSLAHCTEYSRTTKNIYCSQLVGLFGYTSSAVTASWTVDGPLFLVLAVYTSMGGKIGAQIQKERR